MCWLFEVLVLKKCTNSEVSYHITKSPHAFLFKGEPDKKKKKKAAWSQMVGEAGWILLFTWFSWSLGDVSAL